MKKLSIALALLALGLVGVAPAGASPGPGGGGERFAQGGDAPSRVARPAKRAKRAIDRAADRIEDGEDGSTALATTRRNLARALKAANRRVSAGAESGPASAGVVSAVQHKVVDEATGLFDGADAPVVTSLAETLDAAIDGRDALIAAIAALPAEDQGSYGRVLEQIEDDVAEEIEAIDEALADDTLTAEARTALEEARAKLVATQSAVQALAGASGDETTAAADEEGDRGERGDCDGERREEGARFGPRRGDRV